MNRVMSFGGRCAAVVVSLAVLAGCGPSVPDTVKIGVGVTLSGATGSRGQDLLNGALLAAEELNASSFRINGRPVRFEIVPKDDRADGEITRKVAQEFLDEGVHAVIGHLNTPQSHIAVPIYATKKLPNLFTSTNKNTHALGAGNTFRLVANDQVQARALAVFATENLRGARIAAIVESSDYGRDMYADMETVLKERGHAVALRIDVDLKDPVTADMARRLKEAKVDVVVAVCRELQTASLMDQLKAAQHTAVSVLAVNPSKTTRLAKSEIPVAALYATATTIDFAELPGSGEFLTKFRAKFRADPVWGAHYSYDAIYALAGAIKHTGSVEPAKLNEVLRTRELSTRYLHQLRFNASGEQTYAAIGVYKVERGAWVPQMRTGAW